MLRACILLLIWGGVTVSAQAVEPLSEQQLDFFEKKVRPLLVKHCYEMSLGRS